MADRVEQLQAELAGLPTLSRHVFLDHDPAPKAIRAALEQAAERSRTEPTVAIAPTLAPPSRSPPNVAWVTPLAYKPPNPSDRPDPRPTHEGRSQRFTL